MANQLDITPAQELASDRHDLADAVYLLSGTLVGRGAVPDAVFYWSNRQVTVPLGAGGAAVLFEPYLGPPRDVLRAMGFEPGSEPASPAVRIPVRNLPFAHSESLVASITDQDFRVENTAATLRVGYVRPGQVPEDLAAADWTPLVLDGFLGPADEVALDGFILPVYNRGARRNQELAWPQLPGIEQMTGGAIDLQDAATMPPYVVGSPRDWVRVPTLNAGVRGHLASGYAVGDTVLKFRALTGGPEDLTGGNAATTGNFDGDASYGTGTGLAGLQVHYLSPVYDVSSAAYDGTTGEFTVTLASGLAADVARGGFVQQWGPGYNPTTEVALGEDADGIGSAEVSWWWCLGNESIGNIHNPAAPDSSVRFGWLFPDGTVKPADPDVWPLFYATNPTAISLKVEGGNDWGDNRAAAANINSQCAAIYCSRGTRAAPNAPVYYDPVASATEVQEQPEFEATQSSVGSVNRATGGTGTDNDKLRDGSEETGRAFAAGEAVTLTFEDAPAPYANGDTIKSTLHIVMSTASANGIRFTDSTGSVEFAEITPPVTGVQTFAIAQSTPRDYNETVRVVAPTGGGGSVFEVWWEHDLSGTFPSTRTQDVSLTSGATVGPEMEFAELVMQVGSRGMDTSFKYVTGVAGNLAAQTSGQWREVEPGFVGGENDLVDDLSIAYPTAVMAAIQGLLGEVEGKQEDVINAASYDAAHARFKTLNIRLNFTWTDDNRPSSWSELERQVGEQTRSHMFYGPSGHEILVMEDANTIEASPVQQSFRLPGCPGTNTIATGQPLFQRTRTTELVNFVDIDWNPNQITGDMRSQVNAENADSIADVGVRKSDRGSYQFSLHSAWDGHPSYDGQAVVSGIAQFYADRQAQASTRFTFDTAWIAHGLDRGSIVRVSYPVSTTPESFRNVAAEVESVSVAPLNAERFTITARSVSKPQKGLEPAFTWSDVFDTGDVWTDRILQAFDTWSDYWSAP